MSVFEGIGDALGGVAGSVMALGGALGDRLKDPLQIGDTPEVLVPGNCGHNQSHHATRSSHSSSTSGRSMRRNKMSGTLVPIKYLPASYENLLNAMGGEGDILAELQVTVVQNATVQPCSSCVQSCAVVHPHRQANLQPTRLPTCPSARLLP